MTGIANGLTLPNSLANGQTTDASLVMANYNTLLVALNRALLDAGGGSGMNAYGSVMHNLGAGAVSTDAVNLGQLAPYLTQANAAATYATSAGSYATFLTQANAAASFANSLAGSGYQKMLSGLILQWGTASQVGSSGSQAITFPIAFPTTGLIGFATNLGSSAPTAFHGTLAPGVSGMTVYSASSAGVAAPSGVAFNWLVLGK